MCSRCWSGGTPAAHGEEHGEVGCAPAAHGGPWWSSYPPAARGGPYPRADGHPKEAVTPQRAHIGAGSWQDLWACGQTTSHWSGFAGRTCDPLGDPCWSSLFLKDCTSWKGHTLEQFVKSWSSWEEPTLEHFVENCLPWE